MTRYHWLLVSLLLLGTSALGGTLGARWAMRRGTAEYQTMVKLYDSATERGDYWEKIAGELSRQQQTLLAQQAQHNRAMERRLKPETRQMVNYAFELHQYAAILRQRDWRDLQGAKLKPDPYDDTVLSIYLACVACQLANQ